MCAAAGRWWVNGATIVIGSSSAWGEAEGKKTSETRYVFVDDLYKYGRYPYMMAIRYDPTTDLAPAAV